MTLRLVDRGVEIAPIISSRASRAEFRRDPVPTYADPDHWHVAMHIGGARHRHGDRWSSAEIIHALSARTTARGQPPYVRQWEHANTAHPNSTTVIDRFGSRRNALAAAGLELAPVTRHDVRVNGTCATRNGWDAI